MGMVIVIILAVVMGVSAVTYALAAITSFLTGVGSVLAYQKGKSETKSESRRTSV